MWRRELTAERKTAFARLAQHSDNAVGREIWEGSYLPWTPICHLSKGSKLMLVVLFKQALNKSCHEESMLLLISETCPPSSAQWVLLPMAGAWALGEERRKMQRGFFCWESLRKAERISWRKERVKQVYLILETWRGKGDIKRWEFQ